MYPKEVSANLKYRAEIIEKADKDPYLRGLLKRNFYENILFAFNTYFWTLDDRTNAKDLPFVTWEYQDEAILKINECIEKGKDLFGDKSRDMGMSYMVLYVVLWRWMTKRENFLIGSRKQEYVDRSGDMNTLFEKLRYALDRMPYYLLPKGFDKRKHATFMRLYNPEFRCAIMGEATNPDFGRGGRPKAILFDEFSAWEKAEEAYRSASDATQCKIVIGTPKGSANKFAELARTDDIKEKLHLLWYIHPKKAVTSEEYLDKVRRGEVRVKGQKIGFYPDQSKAPKGCYLDHSGKIRSEWYDGECNKRTPEDVRENLDCDYLTTGNPVFDTVICKEMQLIAKEPEFIGDLVWIEAPAYNEYGVCVNFEGLAVEFIPNMNGKFKIWEKPDNTWDFGYSISADVAEGLEQGDNDSASVIKRFMVDKPKVVATLHGKMKTHEYAEALAKLGAYYGKCVIAVERNNTMGGAVLEQLFRFYKNLYHKEIFSKGYPTRTDKLGWETTSGSKGSIIGNLSKLISTKGFEDNDENFWKESLTFVNNDGTLEAMGKSQGQKCYDDRIMDRAIGLWIHGQLPLPTPKVARKPQEGWRKKFGKKSNNSLVRFTV